MKRRDILKDNLPIFHQAAMGTIGLDIFEIDYLKFWRFGVKMWIQNNSYNKCIDNKKFHSRLPGTWIRLG